MRHRRKRHQRLPAKAYASSQSHLLMRHSRWRRHAPRRAQQPLPNAPFTENATDANRLPRVKPLPKTCPASLASGSLFSTQLQLQRLSPAQLPTLQPLGRTFPHLGARPHAGALPDHVLILTTPHPSRGGSPAPNPCPKHAARAWPADSPYISSSKGCRPHGSRLFSFREERSHIWECAPTPRLSRTTSSSMSRPYFDHALPRPWGEFAAPYPCPKYASRAWPVEASSPYVSSSKSDGPRRCPPTSSWEERSGI